MTDHYDLVVVGGGIHGAGVAQGAAVSGYRVLVLEQKGLASGTSSRSSKLIHGGLRYLESGQFSLVRECLRERATLLRIAPELVQLRPFHIPVYRSTLRPSWQMRVGLSIYALLGGLRRACRFEAVDRSQWSDLDGLVTDDLVTVFRYCDAQTDDAALTRAVMASAQAHGAHLAMPVHFAGADLCQAGCRVDYIEGGVAKSCEAHVLVNAAGPWVGQVLGRIRPRCAGRAVELVQGTHILLPGSLHHGIYYLEAPQDQRGVFVMPWGQDTLVGTTETPYRGDPQHAVPLAEEKSYLMQVVQHYFPHFGGGEDSIVSSFAGLRVLPAGTGKAFKRSRETIIDTDRPRRPRVATIYGGKLTSYRSAAEKVMRTVAGSLPAPRNVADTSCIPLSLEGRKTCQAPFASPARSVLRTEGT